MKEMVPLHTPRSHGSILGGSNSEPFSCKYGVKQGAVLSPLLSCLDMDNSGSARDVTRGRGGFRGGLNEPPPRPPSSAKKKKCRSTSNPEIIQLPYVNFSLVSK